MHKLILCALLLLLAAPSVFALCCGDKLVSEGNLKFEVLLACGEPVSREEIGYIDQERDGDRIRVLKIEEWIVKTRGYYYSMVFEGNVLKKIEGIGAAD